MSDLEQIASSQAANSETYWVSEEEDDKQIRSIWRAACCPFSDECSQQAWTCAKCWSIASENRCRAYVIRHLVKSDYHKMKFEAALQHASDMQIEVTEDTYQDRKQWRDSLPANDDAGDAVDAGKETEEEAGDKGDHKGKGSEKGDNKGKGGDKGDHKGKGGDWGDAGGHKGKGQSTYWGKRYEHADDSDDHAHKRSRGHASGEDVVHLSETVGLLAEAVAKATMNRTVAAPALAQGSPLNLPLPGEQISMSRSKVKIIADSLRRAEASTTAVIQSLIATARNFQAEAGVMRQALEAIGG